MQELINWAFHNVRELADPVQNGFYDLIGPDGEIILPSAWNKAVEPEWSITMAMWRLDRIHGAGHVPPTATVARVRKSPKNEAQARRGAEKLRERGTLPLITSPALRAQAQASDRPPVIQIAPGKKDKTEKKTRSPTMGLGSPWSTTRREGTQSIRDEALGVDGRLTGVAPAGKNKLAWSKTPFPVNVKPEHVHTIPPLQVPYRNKPLECVYCYSVIECGSSEDWRQDILFISTPTAFFMIF